MTKLPHLASKAAVGIAATVSSPDRPCFLSAATLSRIATSMSRNSLSSALLLTGFPWPGMMMVLSVDVQVIVANSKTSGAGRWAFLTLWGAMASAKTHDPSTLEGLKESQAAARTARDFPVYKNAEARAAIATFYNHNVPVLDTGARGSTVTFAQKQLG